MGVSRRNRRVADSLPRYLERRPGGVYGCRIDVPQRLRSQLGQRKFVVSHQTRDLATALIRHKPVVARLLGLIQFADAAQLQAPPRLTPVQLQATTRQIAELYVAQEQAPLLLVPAITGPLADLAIGEPMVAAPDAQALAEVRAYGKAATAGEDALSQWRTAQLHQAQQLLARVWHPDDSAEIALAHHRARVLALRVAAGQQVDWERYLSGTAALEALPDPALVLPNGDGQLTIDALVERWIEHRRPATKTAVALRGAAVRLAAVAGTNAAHQVDLKVARAYRDMRLGSVAAVTVRKELGLFRPVWAWALGEDLLSGNPWDSVRVTRGDSGMESRLPFTTEQIEVILAGCSELDDQAMRWSWPLGLMLGARIEEICCIRRVDLQVRDGIACVVIDPEAQLAGRLKTRSSERVVPLPAALLALGFWEWAKGQNNGYLFDAPSIPAADPRRSHSLSIRNGKSLRAWGITSRRLVFHSTRHTFSARAVAAGLPDRLIQTLMGHSTGKSMTARYSGAYTIEQLKAGIDQVSWPNMEGDNRATHGDSKLGEGSPRRSTETAKRTA